jgi:hypothetical protein
MSVAHGTSDLQSELEAMTARISAALALGTGDADFAAATDISDLVAGPQNAGFAAAPGPAKRKSKKSAKPAQAMATLPPLDVLTQRFNLTRFERDVILLAALPALESSGGNIIALAQGDARRQVPSIAFALSTLSEGHWSAFAANGALRSNDLVTLTDDPVASARGILLPERVLHHLVGLSGLDEGIIGTASLLQNGAVLAKAQNELTALLAAKITAGADLPAQPIIQVIGPDRTICAHFAAAAAARLGYRAYLIDAEALPAQPNERAKLARLWTREAKLTDTLIVLDVHDCASPQDTRAAGRFAAAIGGPVIMLASENVQIAHRQSLRVDMPRSSVDEQCNMWRAHLGPALTNQLDGHIEHLATHFIAPPEVIAQTAYAAQLQALEHEAADISKDDAREQLQSLLWRETRERTRPKLDELAQRIDTRAGWDNLILPPRQLAMLKAVAAQVKQRNQVYENWGFAGANSRGLGINALFAGPSGTGKTLAAEVIGAALGLDVYRIDLSSVVSKWVGETEKNLKRVFDAAEETSAVLLFDEADALLGKRTEVRESHDRYANIEVSYLLQRMETYRGLALLTTNLRSHVDQAFLRRLRFVVEFPFPGDIERCAIWKLAFPKLSPCEGLDFGRLAQLNVAGGSIKNIAINAAFLAADANGPIRMAHVRAAARSEYEKLGKPLTDGELRGWAVEEPHA